MKSKAYFSVLLIEVCDNFTNITREEKTDGMAFFSGYSFNKEMMDTLAVTVLKAQ